MVYVLNKSVLMEYSITGQTHCVTNDHGYVPLVVSTFLIHDLLLGL